MHLSHASYLPGPPGQLRLGAIALGLCCGDCLARFRQLRTRLLAAVLHLSQLLLQCTRHTFNDAVKTDWLTSLCGENLCMWRLELCTLPADWRSPAVQPAAVRPAGCWLQVQRVQHLAEGQLVLGRVPAHRSANAAVNSAMAAVPKKVTS